MNTRSALALSFSLAITWFGASFCAQANDFDKATLVGEIKLERASDLRRELLLPAGRARLVLAIRNFRCVPVEASVQVNVSGPDGLVFSEELPLSRLTWSYGRDSCDAVGYLESLDPSVGETTKNSGQMRLSIGRNHAQFTFDVKTIDGNSTNGRTATLWLIYGDRVPFTRIFGSAYVKERP